jgi:predicted nucleic acid-binding protein
VIPAFVVDASLAIAWVREAQATVDSDAALELIENGSGAVAPALWRLEVANALLMLVRRGKITMDDFDIALERLKQLGVVMDVEFARLPFETVSKLAVEHALTVYDASYLELALRLNLPLACKDEPLKAAAAKAGVQVWSAGNG